MRMRKCVLIGIFIIAISLFSGEAFATITGTVTDNVGDPVEGSLVTFTNESDSNDEFSDYTDSNGWFELPFVAVSVEDNLPPNFSLEQNYPNPFNPTTTISYLIDKPGYVNLTIYNITGQRVRTLVDGYRSNGSHITIWNGLDERGGSLAAGIYFYRLRSGDQIQSRKMLLVDGGGSSKIISRIGFVAKLSLNNEIKTYHVTITGDDIETYEESGLVVVDRGIYDFSVVRKTSETEIYGITFVPIPADTFKMGSSGYFFEEKPVHSVTLDGFQMSVYEITNAQYVAYLYEALDAGEITVGISAVEGPGETFIERQYIKYHSESFQKCQIRYNENENAFEIEPGKENNPITNVSWYGAKAFALYYGFDLPTEAEWEYACRAGTNTKYYTGNNMSGDGKTSTDLDLAGWYLDNSEGVTHPIGLKEPNAWGLYDMHGNVEELCHDWYDFNYYSNSSSDNPTGPSEEVFSHGYSIRGGSYSDFANTCRSFSRKVGGGCSSFDGFRVVHRAGSSHY